MKSALLLALMMSACGGGGDSGAGGEADASVPPAECAEYCAGIPATGADGDTNGNTIQCRLYHLGAAEVDPDTHCMHAGSDGGGVCVD